MNSDFGKLCLDIYFYNQIKLFTGMINIVIVKKLLTDVHLTTACIKQFIVTYKPSIFF